MAEFELTEIQAQDYFLDMRYFKKAYQLGDDFSRREYKKLKATY